MVMDNRRLAINQGANDIRIFHQNFENILRNELAMTKVLLGGCNGFLQVIKKVQGDRITGTSEI